MVEKTQGFGEFSMRRFGLIALLAFGLAAPAFAQQTTTDWNYEASLCYDQKQPAAERLPHCTAAIELGKQNQSVTVLDRAKLYTYRSDAYLGLKDYPKAIADADAGQKESAYDVQALNMQCWTRAVANVELDKALAACTEAIRINKDDPAPFDSRGLVNLRLGKWAEAFEDYRVAARFLTMPYSRYGAGLAVIAHGGDIPRGEGLVATALERDPKAGDQLNELGFTPEKMKELGAASRAKPQ